MKAMLQVEEAIDLNLPFSQPAVEISTLTRKLLRALGEDPCREGLRETPKRVEKAWKFLTSGYSENIEKVIGNAIFNEPSGELVLVKDIEFYSLCEHHMLPFFGKIHVAYVPNGKVIGLSKIPRIVEHFARRLQVQERLTSEVANQLMESLQPRGVAVIAEASHMCMMMRGVQKQQSTTFTKATLGEFSSNSTLQSQLLSMIGRSNGF